MPNAKDLGIDPEEFRRRMKGSGWLGDDKVVDQDKRAALEAVRRRGAEAESGSEEEKKKRGY